MKIQNRIESFVLRFPRSIILFFAALTIASAMLLPQLTRDPSPYLLAKDHPSRVNLEILREAYTGTRNSILVLLEAEDTVYTRDTLTRIQELTEVFEGLQIVTQNDLEELKDMAGKLSGEPKKRLESILNQGFDEDTLEELLVIQEMVLSEQQKKDKKTKLLERIVKRLTPVREVTSLANTDNILGTDEGLDVNPIFEEVPDSKAAMVDMRETVWSNQLFRNMLITEDGKHSGIFIELALDDDDTEEQSLVYQKIINIMENEIPGNEKHYIAGTPAITAVIGKTMQLDTQRLFPLVVLIVIGCLWITFRIFKGIIVPLAVVILSLILTLALKVLFNIPINIVTSGLPIFIVSIGVADGIHLFSEYKEHMYAGLDKIEALKKTIQNLTMPVILTSFTTAIAFWSLSITEIVKIKHFGIFVAVGTLIAMVLSLLFIPAILAVLPERKNRRKNKSSMLDQYFTRGLEYMSRKVITNPRPILIVTALILSLAIYGTFLVKIDNNPIGYLMPDSDIVKATNKINQDASGSLTLNLLIRSEKPGQEPLKDPDKLSEIAGLANYLEKHPLVGKTLGLTRLIERINLVLNSNDPLYNRIPNPIEIINISSKDQAKASVKVDGRDMVSQYLLLYENSGGDILTDVVESDYSQTNLTLILKTNSSREVGMLTDDILAYVKVHFPSDLILEFSGTANVEVAATREIVSGQVISLVISFFLVFIMLSYLFKSVQKGLLAMVPLVTTILINFGIMGFFNIPLDIGTAVVSCIVIGIGVDYSIHYLSRLQDSITKGSSFQEGILYTVRHSGKAIAFNALTVGIGFTALLVSVFTPLVTMGWMISMTMFVSAVAAIVVLPACVAVNQTGFMSQTLRRFKNMEQLMIPAK